MTFSVPNPFNELLGLAASGSAYFWLVEVTSSDDGGLTDLDGTARSLRMTTNGVAVNYGHNTVTGEPLTWQSWPIELGAINSTADGSIGSVNIRFANVGGYASRISQLNNQLIDCIVRLKFVSADLLSNDTANIPFNLTVVEVSIANQGVSLRCSGQNLSGATYPLSIITRQCRFIYRDANCGFVATEYDTENTLGQCTKTLGACKARGQWMVDNTSATVVSDTNWPRRFGGFPALPPGYYSV